VLDGIDAHGLVKLAAAHGCVLRLTVPVGTYLPRGLELMEVLGGTPPDGRSVGRMLHSSAARTIYQDPSYGVRQLVDIAIRALPPAVNDPTTAVEALDRLHGVLRAVAKRPDPSGFYVDAHGTVRLIVPVPGWDRLVELALTEVAFYGSGSPQVTRKLMAIFDDLASWAPPERLGPVEAQRAWLQSEVARGAVMPADLLLRPDPLGLG
jgi:uncharacterized membrane protein